MSVDGLLTPDVGSSAADLKVPAPKSPRVDATTAVFHGVELNLGEVADQVSKLDSDVKYVYVYADTVTVSSPAVTLRELNGWQVIARRIVVTEGKFVQLAKSSRLTFYTDVAGDVDNLSSKVKVPFRYPKGAGWADRDVAAIRDHTVSVTAQNDDLKVTDIKGVSLPLQGYPVELSLSLSLLFQTAAQAWTTQRDEAVAVLRWIVALAAQSSHLRDIFAQASRLVALHDSDRPNARFVPYLSKDVYEKQATGYLKSIEKYEENYLILLNDQSTKKQRVDAAKLLLANLKDTQTFHQQLLSQAQYNTDAAAKTLKQAEHNLKVQNDAVTESQKQFQKNIEKYKQQQIQEAVLNGSLALLEAGGSAVKAVQGIAKAIEELKKLVEKIEEAEKALNTGAKIKKTVDELCTAFQMLNRLRQLKQKLGELAGDFDKASLDDIDQLLKELSTDPGGVNAAAQWESMQVTARIILGSFGPGAEYQAALETLSVFGRAYITAQTGFIQASQQLIRCQLQAHLTKRQCDRIAKHVKELEKDKPLGDPAVQDFYQGYLDQKCWVFLAVENYCRAFRYWSMTESKVKPTMSGDALHLANQLTQISQDYEEALNKLKPAPQKFRDKRISITKGIESLKGSARELKVPVELDNALFNGTSRVRVTTVRVYLNGAKPAAGKNIVVGVHTSGSFADRMMGVPFQFTAVPGDRTFEYHPDKKAPIVDGKIDTEFGKVTFQPSAFTQWRFTIRPEHNQGLDLSGLTSVTIEFHGSLIYDTTLIAAETDE